MPKRVISTLRGHVRRPGRQAEARELCIEVQWQAEHSKDGGFVFKERAAEFHLQGGQYAGIIVCIKHSTGQAAPGPLEENSVTLTVAQAEQLAAHLTAEVATIKKLAKMRP
jgi:hypothetical protein